MYAGAHWDLFLSSNDDYSSISSWYPILLYGYLMLSICIRWAKEDPELPEAMRSIELLLSNLPYPVLLI